MRPHHLNQTETAICTRGIWLSDRIFSGKRTTEENKEYNVWDPENISQENLDYLVKIINLCEKKGVDLNLIIPPVTDSFLERAGDSQVCMIITQISQGPMRWIYMILQTTRTVPWISQMSISKMPPI